MAMTKRNDIGGKIISQGKARATKYPKHNQGSPSHSNQGGSPPRLSPVMGSPVRSPVPEPSPRSSPGLLPSPRSSPGLLARHYAGCKFTEPPSASALPLPPQHWMQVNRSMMLPFQATTMPCAVDQHHNFTQCLKLLLKVQA